MCEFNVNPGTHLMMSWAIAETLPVDNRDKRLISWAGVMPDLDGIGAVVDLANSWLGRMTTFYEDYHHFLLHGLFGALVISGATALLSQRRWRTALFAFAVIHVHLLADVVGSRGPSPVDVWPIHCLGPFSHRWTIAWTGQWPLNSWPNQLVAVGLLGMAIWSTVARKRSPATLFGERANDALIRMVSRQG
jgi:hypothetical protein